MSIGRPQIWMISSSIQTSSANAHQGKCLNDEPLFFIFHLFPILILNRTDVVPFEDLVYCVDFFRQSSHGAFWSAMSRGACLAPFARTPPRCSSFQSKEMTAPTCLLSNSVYSRFQFRTWRANSMVATYAYSRQRPRTGPLCSRVKGAPL